MTRRRVTKNTFACGHKGRGKSCHRCEQAEMMREVDAKYVTGKKNPDKKTHRVWTKAELLAESARLFALPVREVFNV